MNFMTKLLRITPVYKANVIREALEKVFFGL